MIWSMIVGKSPHLRLGEHVHFGSEVLRQRIEVEGLVVIEILVRIAPAALRLREVGVHVHRRDRRWRKDPVPEDRVAVVADLLAQDRLAVLDERDEALGADLLEFLGQEQGASLIALVSADGVCGRGGRTSGCDLSRWLAR